MSENLEHARQDYLRHLAYGLTETDFDFAWLDAECSSVNGVAPLLIGVSGLRTDLLAWAEGQMRPTA